MIKPGIYYDMTNEEYHSEPDYLSNSLATRIHRAPALALVKQDATKAMNDGRRIHTYILEPEKVIERYFVLPEDHKGTTKAGKEMIAKVSETGLEPITFQEDLQYRSMAASVRRHKFGAALLKNAIVESSIFWTDFVTQCHCKCRPDLLLPEMGVIADLKTTTDASEIGFAKSAGNFGWHRQAAHYIAGAKSVFPIVGRFLFIAVEKTEPYLCAVYELGVDSIARGQKSIENDYRRFYDAKKSGEWPGYPEMIFTIEVPSWAE